MLVSGGGGEASQTCSISYFLLMGGRGWWTWAAPGLKWPIPAGLEEFEREVSFGNNSLPYMSSSSSFVCSHGLLEEQAES